MRRSVVTISSICLVISGLATTSAQANGGYCTTGSFTVVGTEITAVGTCVGIATVPEGITKIVDEAFKNATALTGITIPKSVLAIGEYAFYGASSLATVTFATDSMLNIIDNAAFQGATALTSITIPKSVLRIEDSAFKRAGLTSITIPSSVTSIGDSAFLFATSLNTVTFEPGSKLTSIESDSFYHASALTSITIPASVITIGGGAFDENLSLTSFIFEAGSALTTIGGSAFWGSPLLTSITIPAGVTDIGDYAFCCTDALSSVYFLGNAPKTVGADAFTGAGGILGSTAYRKSGSSGFPTAGLWNKLTVAIGVYTATYNSNGGSAVAAADFTRDGSIASAPTDPTRIGYTFGGWSETEGGGAITFPYSPVVNGDITLFAKWTLNEDPAGSTPASAKSAENLSNSIRFLAGSTVLTKANKAALKRSVQTSGKKATFVVIGAAGSFAGATDAQVKRLAKLRGNVVRAYLVKLGVNKSNISIKIKITNQGIAPKTKILASYLTS
jgi:uncharacterized repeat protein (TIGR02543 family)